MPFSQPIIGSWVMPDDAPEAFSHVGGQFTTTHWSVVVRAGHEESSATRDALSELCRVYWCPLYAFARRQGHARPEAEDLTQDFFAYLMDRGFIGAADPQKGRFRSFLLTAFKRFLANEWHRQHAQKRGGFVDMVSIDAELGESRLNAESTLPAAADSVFDRQWAIALLGQVMNRLKFEYTESGRGQLFEHLEACLTHDESALVYSEIGVRLGLSEAAVKMAMQRLRARYRVILREEIAKTVASPSDVEAELSDLFRTFQQ